MTARPRSSGPGRTTLKRGPCSLRRRQVRVDENEIRGSPLRFHDRFHAVLRLGDHDQIILALENDLDRLPKERVLCTGDLLVTGIANLIDGFVNEWPDALEKLRPLDFVDVIPGHGEPFKGKERIDWFQAYLRDLWKQATALHDQRVPAADAAKRIDMTAHKAHYSTINGPGINPLYAARIYAVIEKKAE